MYTYTYTYIHAHTHKEIYYKELDHIIMEAENSLVLQPASWRARRASGCGSSQCEGLRTRRASGVSCSLKAGRLETQEEVMFQFKYEGRKKVGRLMTQLSSQAGGVPFYSDLLSY